MGCLLYILNTQYALNMEVVSDWPILYLSTVHVCVKKACTQLPHAHPRDSCSLVYSPPCSFKNTERSYRGLLAYDVDVVQLNEEVSKLREHVEGRTNSEICELKRKIQEVGNRVGSIASRVDQEERVQELEKRIEEQDQEIASLKDKLERVLATLGL